MPTSKIKKIWKKLQKDLQLLRILWKNTWKPKKLKLRRNRVNNLNLKKMKRLNCKLLITTPPEETDITLMKSILYLFNKKLEKSYQKLQNKR